MESTTSTLSTGSLESSDVLISSLSETASSAAVHEPIGTGQFQFVAGDADAKVQALMQDPRAIISLFHVALDRGTSVTVPPTLSGTSSHPIYKISLEKCVFLFCQTADLDIEFSVQILEQRAGFLSANLNSNLSRSSAMISHLYSDLLFKIEYKKTSQGGELKVVGEAIQTADWQSGIVQAQVKSMLLRQYPAILEAARASLQGNPVELGPTRLDHDSPDSFENPWESIRPLF